MMGGERALCAGTTPVLRIYRYCSTRVIKPGGGSNQKVVYTTFEWYSYHFGICVHPWGQAVSQEQGQSRRRLSSHTHQTPVIHNIVSSVASSIMASCFLNSRVMCTSMPAPVLVLATGGGAACCQLPGRRWHTACEHVAVVCRGELMVGVKLSAAKVCSLTKVHLTISVCVRRMLCLLPKSSKLSSPSDVGNRPRRIKCFMVHAS